jgi:hypothetical protein
MDTVNREFLCPVCGWLLEEPAWRGDSASDEICPSCGIQFGYQDAIVSPRRAEIHRAWREQWIIKGMPWSSVGQQPPENWNLREQLRRIEGAS